MAVRPAEELIVDEEDLGPLVAVVAELTEAASGWVNLVPEVETGHEPDPRSLVASLFSARGDAVPLATWSAPEAPGRRATLGIEHGSGPKALARLAEAGLPLADGWLKAADHPRRGLVVTAPAGVDPEDAVWWLLTASHALSTVPLTGIWTARVYRP